MNKYYYELTINPSSNFKLFCEIALELSNSAIEENELTNIIILRSEDKDKLDLIEEGIKLFANELSINIITKIEQKKNIDWITEYKKSIKSVTGGKFHIRPSWEDVPLVNNKIDIIIDPALAFGSGHHETTNSCLEAISKYVQQNDKVIDVGCGSGILAIACAKLGAKVDICDTDELAIENSLENFRLNNVSYNNFWIGSANNTNNTYNVVIANILADIILMINKDLKLLIKKDGIMILSGILEKYEDKIRGKFRNFQLIEIIKKNEWLTLIYKNT